MCTMRRLLPLLLLAALAGAASAQPLLTIGQLDAPAVIDGRLDDEVWRRAAGFVGLVPLGRNELAGDTTRVSAFYTAERLYVSYECRFPAGEPLQGAFHGRDDGKPWREDSVEVFLSPAAAQRYQLIGNSAGSIHDNLDGDAGWNGDWEFAAFRGDGVWYAEMSIPFGDLGRGTPQPGEVWRANFCRDVKAGRSGNDCWAPVAASYLETERFGTLRFGGEQPVLRLEDLGAPNFGRVELRGAALGRAPGRLTVDAWVVTAGTTLTQSGEEWAPMVRGKMITARQRLEVPANGATPVAVDRPWDDRELNELQIMATDGNGSVVYRQVLPLALQTPLILRLQPIPRQQRLLLEVESGIAGLDPATAQATVTATDRQGESVAEVVDMLATLAAGSSLDYGAWPVGAYEIAVTVAAGGQVHRAAAPFEVVPQPAWVDHDLGRERVVIPPFKPLQYRADGTEVWGRQTTFGANSVLPTSLTSQGAELLRGPMRLAVTVGGRTQTIPADGPLTFGQRADDRAEFTTGGDALGVTAALDWWQEYDGFTWADLTIAAGQTTRIERLAIEFDLRPEVSELLHGTPNERHHAINEILAIGETHRYPFLPLLWLGSHDRGLCWFTESQQNWVPDVFSENVIEVSRDEAGARLRINLIGEPVELTEARTYGFGLLASPVRPLPGGWSTWFADVWPPSRSTLDWAALGAKPDWGVIWTNKYGQHLTAPLTAPAELGELVALGKQQGVGVAYYIAPGCHSMAYPEPQRYREEWRIHPLDEFYIAEFDETYPRLCLGSSTWADYLLHGIDDVIGKYGIQGIYHDGGAPAVCASEVHGCGWRDGNNKLRHIRPIRATRDYHQRLATLFNQKYDLPQHLIYNHTSDVCWLPTLTFCTAHLDGEQYKGQRRAKIPYREILSAEEIRPEYVSTQWGVITTFLNIVPEAGDTSQRETAEFLSWLLPNGIPFYPRYLNREWHARIQRLYAEFDIDQAEFHPWWRGLPGITSSLSYEQVPVGLWVHPANGRVVALGNPSVTGRLVELTLADPAGELEVLSSGADVSTLGERLKVALPPQGFALVRLR